MAWLFQDHRQKEKLGDKCPWSVGWIDPEGKRKSKRLGSKSRAEKYARKVEGQLAAGTYEGENRKNWADFLREYRAKVVENMEPGTREATEYAIKHFERMIRPVKMKALTSRALADYTAIRRREPRHKGGPPVSVATVNKELRHLRAIIRKAFRWGYLTKLPEIEFLKEPGKLPTYVVPEHFDAIYKACGVARVPDNLPYSTREWWEGLLTMAYMTGWRIGSILALRREDVDLEAGTAISRATDNKGKRDQLIPLHPVVADHLRKLPSFSPTWFPWSYSMSLLREVFKEIQEAAKVKPVTLKRHYTFHDLRRGFASLNADRMTPDALQTLMQHKSYITTQRYIEIGRQLNHAVEGLYVPACGGSEAV